MLFREMRQSMITVAVDKEQEHRQPPVKEEPPFIPAEKQPIEKQSKQILVHLKSLKIPNKMAKLKSFIK